MNASKNEIAIDSVTSTRNKVAFFKNSLAIYRDDFVEIAFKRSNLEQTYSQVRIIFTLTTKAHPMNQFVSSTITKQHTITSKLNRGSFDYSLGNKGGKLLK